MSTCKAGHSIYLSQKRKYGNPGAMLAIKVVSSESLTLPTAKAQGGISLPLQ
jgi:hypothetical protein